MAKFSNNIPFVLAVVVIVPYLGETITASPTNSPIFNSGIVINNNNNMFANRFDWIVGLKPENNSAETKPPVTTSCSEDTGIVTVTENLTNVVKAQGQTCTIKIPKQEGICQIRVDFIDFNILDSNSNGDCPKDSVTFSGASNLPPEGFTLCGKASGQHLYMHYGDCESLTIRSNLGQIGSNYNFHITMIKCNSPERAPDGCTQYYSGPMSTVMSFNYPNQQLNNQNYSVCVNSGYTGNSITWTACTPPASGPKTSFSISGDFSRCSYPCASLTNCPTDYVLIPPGNIRCGLNWTDFVTSTVKPFLLYVNYDEAEEPSIPPLNPETGRPLGFICAMPDLAGKCSEGGSCIAPAYMADLIDYGNRGFCLNYAVA
jgi:hypothetical protein